MQIARTRETPLKPEFSLKFRKPQHTQFDEMNYTYSIRVKSKLVSVFQSFISLDIREKASLLKSREAKPKIPILHIFIYIYYIYIYMYAFI